MKRSWRSYYYPVEADSPEAQDDPLGHCIRKWRGLRAEVRVKYGIEPTLSEGLTRMPYRNLDIEGVVFEVAGNSCALCVACRTPETITADCTKCPITKATGDGCHKAWSEFCTTGNADPMIRLLERTKRWEDAQ